MSPVDGSHLRSSLSTRFRWSGEPVAAASREIVLVARGENGQLIQAGSRNEQARAFNTRLRVRAGAYNWFVVFYDERGDILCTSPVGEFSAGGRVNIASGDVGSGLSSDSDSAIDVIVSGRYVVVLSGSSYTGPRNLDIADDVYDGSSQTVPFGYKGLEIHGNGNSNFLIGSSDSDLIHGYEGDDFIRGGDGDDEIDGGDESCSAGDACTSAGDLIEGGAGNDTIRGGDESCSGDNCNAGESLGDLIHGGDGDDTIIGGNESCTGPSCNGNNGVLGDEIHGDDGNDTITGGNESCSGAACGAGEAQTGDAINGGEGSDEIDGEGGDDQIDGGAGDGDDDTLTGGGDPGDTVTGEGGDVVNP